MEPVEARGELDALLDTAPCGFLTFDDGGHVLLANRTLLELLGYERDDVVGRHIEKLLSVGARIFYQTHLFPLARLHGRADEIFLLLRAKSGEDVGVFVNVRRREMHGGSVYDVALMQVAERAKYEQELLRARREADAAREQVEEQAAELEATTEELAATNEELMVQAGELERLRDDADAANRAKTDFLAVMSHELRTPLNAISGYVQIMEMEIQGPLTDEQRETLGRIDRSQRHLLRLINDLLNLSKLEAGGVDYSIEDVGLAELAASVEPMVEPQALEKQLTVEIDVPAGLVARADRDKLEQIMLNLLSNAIKFTPEGGRIVVHGAQPVDAKGMVTLTVQDSGVGIPADKLEAVFEPFVQVGAGRAQGDKGTGLGLAISRDLARGMGGDLSATSQVDAGSSFTIVLPAASRADSLEAADPLRT